MADKPIHILHIEDDHVDRMVVGRVLKKVEGIASIHHASNGEEAFDKLRGTNGQEKLHPFPQIILLDINMPKMNGIEFLQELRSDETLRALSVYMVTTSSDENDLNAAYRYNVAGYILKPVDISHFEGTFRILADFWKLCEFPVISA